MQIEILTIFPALFENFLSESLIAKAIERNLITFKVTNIRDFAEAPHYKVDDEPYGGGAGMLMKPEPIAAAIEAAKSRLPNAKTILLSASGLKFKQQTAGELSNFKELILVCGRYEGVDQRVIDSLIDYEFSVADFVVMGGEIPAMLLIEAVTRLIPEVLGNSDSLVRESFNSNLLEAPQYTRPAIFRDMQVPDVLVSGDHKKIELWRKEESLKLTRKHRPDLINE